jgi:hypothetical protein
MVSGSERLGPLSDYTANYGSVFSSERVPHRYRTANFRKQYPTGNNIWSQVPQDILNDRLTFSRKVTSTSTSSRGSLERVSAVRQTGPSLGCRESVAPSAYVEGGGIPIVVWRCVAMPSRVARYMSACEKMSPGEEERADCLAMWNPQHLVTL